MCNPTFNPPSLHTNTLGDNGQETLIISIPTFDLTHSCVLVNLATLDCHELTFATSLNRKHNPELARLKEIQSELEKNSDLGTSHTREEVSILHHMMNMDEDEND